jgi:diacylglycerol kinase (ATP)
MPKKRALLLVNRQARHGTKLVAEVIYQLQILGLDFFEESTENPAEIPNIIRRHQNRVDLVIIGGGDGTINAAIAGLIDTQLPLGIIPLGTANDLARTLQIPNTLRDAIEVIKKGKMHRVDVGLVNGHYFFNVASLGLSVNITKRLTPDFKRKWGILAYAITAIEVIFQARPFRAEILVQGKKYKVKTIQIAVGNGRHYGGGLTVAYDATIDDQRLDLYSIETKSWWQILALIPALIRGNQANLPGILTLEGEEIEIFTRKQYPINTDGEITTHTPALFRVIPKSITVCIP